MRGLYVHIPFCVRKCAYCDFYSLPDRSASLKAYLEALQLEGTQYGRLSFDTLYIGGGTPSLIGASGLSTLITRISNAFRMSKVLEATIEANPESISEEFLITALECRLNRVSIGVQSLSDIELQKVGRAHNAIQAVQAIELAQKEGFRNISADVILGLPGQNWESLMTTLECLAGLGLHHLSMYCLTIEPHTPLYSNLPLDLPSDDDQADLYKKAVILLRHRGFRQYEISNFALPGYECQHNLNYWHGGDYVGLGPGAASHYKGYRYINKPDLDAYLANPCGQRDEMEKLKKAEKAAEEAILRLRLMEEGVDLNGLIKKYGEKNIIALAGRLNKLSKKGQLQRNGYVYRLKPDDALISNSILSELLED